MPMVDPDAALFAVLDDVVDDAWCKALIARAEEMGFGDAPISTGTGFEMDKEVRNNTRVMWDDVPLATELWPRTRDHVPPTLFERWDAIGVNERFRVYRYVRGQYFQPHQDGPFIRNPREKSFYTCMLYLNEGFVGGHTVLWEVGNGERVVPKTGRVLLFQHAQEHEGAEVYKGVKYALRTDVMYRRRAGT